MAKLTIIITEKAEELSGGHTVTGYTIDVGVEAEEQMETQLSKLATPIYTAIGYMLTALHGSEPCVAREVDPDASFSLEAEMAKEVARLEAPFPSEL
jgi:hypothetical protein